MQTMQFLYLGGLIDANADIMPEINDDFDSRRLRWFQARAVRYGGCPVHVKGAPATD